MLFLIEKKNFYYDTLIAFICFLSISPLIVSSSLFMIYFYMNIGSSVICWHFAGDMYHSLGISNEFWSNSSVCVGFTDFFSLLVILSAIFFRIKSLDTSTVSWITLFEAVLKVFVADHLTWSRRFLLYLLLHFFVIFLPIFPIFLVKNNYPQLFDI